jgi:aminopeptidase N
LSGEDETMALANDVLSREEAERRFAQVRDLAYRIQLDLHEGAERYGGTTTIEFEAVGSDPTFFEFSGADILGFEIDGEPAVPERVGARVMLPPLPAGRHVVTVAYENEYDHTGEGFHQFIDPIDDSEYLYTGFEPYQAHRLFPCFDQPDLKATFELAVTAPSAWSVISAGRQIAEEAVPDGRLLRRYEPTLPFSTYLFSVIAGPYRAAHDVYGEIPLAIYTRESLFEHLDADEIFLVTKQGLAWYEEFFDRSFPFTKYDQLFVPEFNWGGMENVGAVTYTDTMIFRDPPTTPMRLRRAEILLHELAHMWFGDLVTMKWWNDLWLNESFASFIAYMAIDQASDFDDVWLDFNTRVKAVAYHDDQLPTTHPIADAIETTEETFLNFDQITYGKGASVLRQLVARIGERGFRDGLRLYFRRHAFGNTTLPEFLGALQEGSGVDLIGWASRWLRTTSVNTIAARWQAEHGAIRSLELTQSAPADHPTLRPHTLEVALFGEGLDGTLSGDGLPATIDGPAARVDGAVGRPAPLLVFPNHRDLAYTKVALDDESLATVLQRLSGIDDSLLRQLLWTSLWEMVRDQQLAATHFLDAVHAHLPAEPNPQILGIVTMRAAAAVRRYVPDEYREGLTRALAALALDTVTVAPEGDPRVSWARLAVGSATGPDQLLEVGRLLDGDLGVSGMSIDQDMRWSLAIRWTALGMTGAEERVTGEYERDPSDRGDRAVLRAESSRPDEGVKATIWAKLHERGYGSLYQAASAMAGFGWWEQRDILERFAVEFFDRVGGVFAEWEFEAARNYFGSLFPSWRCSQDTIDRAEALLERSEDVRLRRLLAEEIDAMARALRSRAVAAATLAVEPGSSKGDGSG